MATNRRRGFTLIEVLIVVVIMAVLAATIIPQFSSSTKDAKESSLKFNMHTMKSQIELYKLHHLSSLPTEIGDATTGYLPQLTQATDVSGNRGTAGTSYPYGPYIEGDLPANPFDGKNTVTSVDLGGKKPTAVSGDAGGWQYDPKTGAIWPNNSEYYETTETATTGGTTGG
jgi:general secretion pathway protein G